MRTTNRTNNGPIRRLTATADAIGRRARRMAAGRAIAVDPDLLRRRLPVILMVLGMIATGLAAMQVGAAHAARTGTDGIVRPIRAVGSGTDDQWNLKPIAIAHRGDDSAPENSLHAIANAGTRGADYAEIDVRLTKDGVPVVFHDRKTGRLATNGRDRLVSHLTLTQLRRLTMSQNGETYRIPTLDEAIAQARLSSDRLGLLLDLKTDSRHAPRLTNAVMDRIEANDFAARTMLMATNNDAIRLIRLRHPGWLTGKCVSPADHSPVQWPEDVSFVLMRGERVEPHLIARARNQRIPLYAGVSADYDLAAHCLRLGADGIVGANAQRIRRTVGHYGAPAAPRWSIVQTEAVTEERATVTPETAASA